MLSLWQNPRINELNLPVVLQRRTKNSLCGLCAFVVSLGFDTKPYCL
jgi:hypothetical protein